MKEKFEKMKDLITKEDGKSNKKKIENLVVFIIIIIVTIIAINMIWKTDNKKSNQAENTTNGGKQLATAQDQNQESQTTNKEALQSNLEMILSKINGVGNVQVLITYSESSQTVAMYNENKKETSTEEKDTNGGTRVITETDSQKDVIYKENSGSKEPIVQKTVMPKVEGAVVTAQGANNAEVKTSIVQAVEAVTGLATHKIQVFEMVKQ